MDSRPHWLQLGEDLLWASIGAVLRESVDFHYSIDYLDPLPYMAGSHLASCMQLSIDANKDGDHSAAICLVRQCLESLTVIEIGYQNPAFAEQHLLAWLEGKKSHGELRQALENDIWPSYGTGLWDEPWPQFFGNLARAVQPYAHYTPELQGWQIATIKNFVEEQRSLVAIGPNTYDDLKAARITLFHVLLGWTLSRVLLASPISNAFQERASEVQDLGKAIADSKLLFKGQDWGTQLIPHVMFKPGHDWRDS